MTKRGNPLPKNRDYSKATKNYLGALKMVVDQDKKPMVFALEVAEDGTVLKHVVNRAWEGCEGLKQVFLSCSRGGPLSYLRKATRQLTYYGLNGTGKEHANRLRAKRSRRVKS